MITFKGHHTPKPIILQCVRWRMEQTYIKVRGQWRYYYRAGDKEGNTIDFLLTAKRDPKQHYVSSIKLSVEMVSQG